MKNLTTIFLTIVISTITIFAQIGDEKEILKFIADYDQAYVKKDITFLESNFAPEYTAAVDGRNQNRAELLEEAKAAKANSKDKTLELKSTNETLRIVGNVAFATGFIQWKSVSASSPNAEPNTGKEHYTIVLEKRGGKWLLVSEHISSVNRDRKLMEAEVLKASQEYNQMLKTNNVAAMEKILAKEYFFTNESGKIINKEQELLHQKNINITLDIMEITDQKVRVIGNNAAVETGSFKYKGSENGKPLSVSGRYTTTWMRRDEVWQIVADHTSLIK